MMLIWVMLKWRIMSLKHLVEWRKFDHKPRQRGKGELGFIWTNWLVDLLLFSLENEHEYVKFSHSTRILVDNESGAGNFIMFRVEVIDD